MFWTALLLWTISTVLLELVRPKPNLENARPAGLGDFKFPTATEGRVVPLIWGMVKIDGPNVVWFGGLRVSNITEEIKTGIFSDEDVVVGHKYSIGIQFALCRGPNVELKSIHMNDKLAFNGTLDTDAAATSIDKKTIFGGQEFGNGGALGVLRWYTGSLTQNITGTYLAGKQANAPSYRGTAFAVWEGGYLGNSSQISPWSFVAKRIPDGLNLAVENPGAEEPEPDTSNPMNVLYEMLTDTNWGLHVPIADIDQVNFREAAAVLATEGNGFGMVLDSPRSVEDAIREVERQIDGSVFFDRSAAQWRCKLARDDYVVDGLPLFDESNIVELVDYTRQTWEETTNQVRVKYADMNKEFNDSYALAQDLANVSIQNASVSVDMTFPGVKTAANANKIAWRELKVQAFPLGKISLKINRQAFQLLPGSVFKFSWARLGVASVVYRVSKINPGNLDSNFITVSAIQDVFAAGTAVFSDPTPSGWVDEPDTAVAPLAIDTLALEAPRQLVLQDTFAPDLQPRVFMGARLPGGATTNFKAYSRIGTSRPLSNDFVADAPVNAFLLVGTLNTALPVHGVVADRPYIGYDIIVDNDSPDNLDELAIDGGPSLVTSLRTIAYIDGEYVGFEAVVVSGSTYRLKRVYRGLFHTAAKAHVLGTRVWFIGQTGGNLSRTAFPSTAYDEIDIQLRSDGAGGELEEGDVPIIDRPVDYVWLMPLAPRDPLFHTTAYAPATSSADIQYTSGTGRTGHDARAIKIEFTPRAWRIDGMLDDHNLALSSPSYLGDSPTFDTVLTLDPDGTPIVLAALVSSGTETPVEYLLRNAMVIAAGANTAIPGTGKIEVTAEHTVDSVVHTNPLPLTHTFTLTSTLQDDELLHGGLTKDVDGTAVDYGEVGVYSFDIHDALDGIGLLEASVDGAAFVTVVGVGVTTGNLTTVGTAPFSVVLRFTDVPPNGDTLFNVTGPTAEVGHGVLLS